MKPLVFLCQPRYNAMIDSRAHRAFLSATRGACNISFGTEKIGGSPMESQTSVLPQAFNAPWVMALNLRKYHSISEWAMLHADIEAQYGWLDVLVAERRRLKCDILSVVVPFKVQTGITSTAVGQKGWPLDAVDPAEKPKRLTMHEIYQLPRSFSIKEIPDSIMGPGKREDKILLVNTGCWVCDFSKPWVEKIVFRFHNWNYQDASGLWHTACRSEDFDLSVQAARLGLSVYATTIVPVQHHGDAGYPNDQPWGLQQTDDEFQAYAHANNLYESKPDVTGQPVDELQHD